MFYKIDVLKNFAKLQENPCVGVFVLIKFHASRKRPRHRRIPANSCQFYCSHENSKYYVHQQRKKMNVTMLNSLSNFSRKIAKIPSEYRMSIKYVQERVVLRLKLDVCGQRREKGIRILDFFTDDLNEWLFYQVLFCY